MIKIKVYEIAYYWKHVDNKSFTVFDFNYTVTFFGFIIHSVIIREIDKETKKQIFNDKHIINKL